MINLLPPQQKEELREEENLKLILILGIVFVGFLISLFLILSFIKIYLSNSLVVQKLFLEEKEKEASLNKDFEEKIKSYNQNLLKLGSFYENQLNLTEVFEKISQILPSGTYLTDFSFNLVQEAEKKGKGLPQISLTGFCPSREILMEFKESLEKEEKFKDVSFPPENWVRPNDINFRAIFQIKS